LSFLGVVAPLRSFSFSVGERVDESSAESRMGRLSFSSLSCCRREEEMLRDSIAAGARALVRS
jgi:hypothetical protein